MARDTVQADRLEAVLSGEVAPEDVSSDLARLASLASTLHDEVEVEAPSEVFRARLRTQLLATEPAPSLLTRLQDRVAEGTARLRHSMRVAGATAMASTLIGTTGVAAAAQGALPGDLLYGVKGATEDVRMAFASDAVERARLHLTFARERLEEVESGVGRLGPGEFESALVALDEDAAAGANLLLAEPPTPEVRGELTAFTGEVRSRLTAVAPQLPLSVRPATEHTLEVLRRIDLQLQGLLAGRACEQCGQTAAEQLLPRVVLPGDGPARAPACPCAGTTGADGDDADGEPAGQDASAEPSDPRPSLDGELVPPSTEPSGDSSGGLSGTIRDTGTLVDDLLGDTGDTVGSVTDQLGDTVDEGASELESTVGDVATDLDTTVDDLGSTVEDTVDDVGSAVDDTLDDAGGLLGD